MDLDRVRGFIMMTKTADKVALAGGGLDLPSVDRPKLDAVELGEFVLPHAVAEPLQIALGCTFSPELCAEAAKATAAAAYDAELAFAGTVGCGLIRDPMSPSAAELFSEDPLVVAELLKGYTPIDGFGFVFTDSLGQERFVDRTIDARALRELYLYPLIKAGMSAAALRLDGGYLNGERVCDSRDVYGLLTGCIPPDAMVITQYGDMPSAENLFGNGLYILGAPSTFKRDVLRDIAWGAVDESDVDSAIERTLAVAVKTHNMYSAPDRNCFDGAAMPDIARDATVLLKNDGVLPASGKRPTFFGDPAQFGNAVYPINDAVKSHGSLNVFLVTDYENNGVSDAFASAIVNVAAVASTAVVFCGCCAVQFDFADKVNAVLFCPQRPSIAQLTAMLVDGESSPRGHLPFTWSRYRADYPCNNKKFAARGDFRYESMYSGYMLFNNFAYDVSFPFGHGLDYTRYELSKLKLSSSGSKIAVEFVVKNEGAHVGVALCQVYVSLPDAPVYGISKRLAAFKRVPLDPTENSKVTLEIDINDLAVYNDEYDSFTAVGGKYIVDIGLSSVDIRLHGDIKVAAASRVVAGLGEKAAPTYFAAGKGAKFEPTAPEIERLLKVPFIKKADAHPELAPPPAATIKKALKRADKWTDPSVRPVVRYRISTTPVRNQPK